MTCIHEVVHAMRVVVVGARDNNALNDVIPQLGTTVTTMPYHVPNLFDTKTIVVTKPIGAEVQHHAPHMFPRINGTLHQGSEELPRLHG